MKIYFNIDEHNRLNGYSTSPSPNPSEVSMKVPDGHEVLTNPFIFKYENGELVKDIEYQNKLIEQEEAEAKRPSDEEMNAIAIMELTEMIMKGGQ